VPRQSLGTRRVVMPQLLEVYHLDHCSVLITDAERSRKFYGLQKE
jgi:hypothetical protein